MAHHPLEQILASSKAAPYNAEVKAQFRRDGSAFLRKLARDMDLNTSRYTIRWNKGGIAVSGDLSLAHAHFYLSLADGMAYVRSTSPGNPTGTGVNSPNNHFTEDMEWEQIRRIVRKCERVGRLRAEGRTA